MKSDQPVKKVLAKKFETKYVNTVLTHYSAAIGKFAVDDWEGVAVKGGKFVEAVTKTLLGHCGQLIANPRNFSAGRELRNLEKLDSTKYSETIRIVVPRACLLVYEIANNRGGRHDAGEIDANEMDAKLLIPVISWVMAELVRFSSSSGSLSESAVLIQELTNKQYPYFEDIDGRAYVNISNTKPGEVALLLLYSNYPKRISRQDLVDQVKRHGASLAAATSAVHRLKNLVDDQDGDWKLRGNGRLAAESLLKAKRE